MKKILTTLFVVMAVVTASFAQQAANPYSFKTQKDVDAMLKVLSNDLKPSPEQFTRIQELLAGSFTSQQQTANSDWSKDPKNMELAMTRQEKHIEGNLKMILGDALFNTYVNEVKPKLAEKTAAIRAKMTK